MPEDTCTKFAVIYLKHISQVMFHFYTPCKRQKKPVLFWFSGGTEKDPWYDGTVLEYQNIETKGSIVYKYVLHDLVPFGQFRKREKHSWKSVTFSKVADWNVTLLRVCFPSF